jgi:hypothetical protein
VNSSSAGDVLACKAYFHAIVQAVSRWLHSAAVRFRSQVKICGICGGQSGAGAGFLQVLRFPLQIVIPQTAAQSFSISSGAGTLSQLVADVPSGLSHPIKII